MVVYCTEKSEYPITKIGELDAITANRGINEGKLYGIVGFWERGCGIDIIGREFVCYRGTSEEKFVSYDELPNFLEREAKIGKNIVARLLNGGSGFVPEGTPHDLLITSKIREIKQ